MTEFEKWKEVYINDQNQPITTEWTTGDMRTAFDAGQKCPTKDVQDVLEQAVEEVRHAREVLKHHDKYRQYQTRISINLGQYTDKLNR